MIPRTRVAAEGLTFAYAFRHDVLSDVTVSVGEGEVLFVLGANGSGKTTLLECLAGLRSPRRGRVLLDGDRADELSPGERARRVGLVPQMHEPVFDYTVGEVVLMGRTPHLGLFSRPGPKDWDAVDRALAAVGLRDLRGRVYTEISGGERQLALIARGLAQGATCLLMDEPAAHLDPHHEFDVFAAVTGLVKDGFSFIISSHRPSNALLYADRVAFLVNGRIDAQGTPEEAVTEATLAAAYGIEFELVRGGTDTLAILPKDSLGKRR